MTPIAYTPTDEQLRQIADEITAEARYRADDAESNGYDSIQRLMASPRSRPPRHHTGSSSA